MLAAVQDTVQEFELDRGAASVAPGTHRSCALTREFKPVAEMIRFVVAPGDTVVADVKRKLPGRGLWITGTRAAVEEAVKRNVFARGFKRKVGVAAGLADQTEDMLERAALDALAVAGKAGLVVAGFAKVESALGRNECLALLHASDGGVDGKRKLDGTLRRIREETDGIDRKIAVIEEFSGAQLDLALNRPNVVHAALLAGPGSETFLARGSRLVRFRTGKSLEAVSAHAPMDRA